MEKRYILDVGGFDTLYRIRRANGMTFETLEDALVWLSWQISLDTDNTDNLDTIGVKFTDSTIYISRLDDEDLPLIATLKCEEQ